MIAEPTKKRSEMNNGLFSAPNFAKPNPTDLTIPVFDFGP
jgi:hypothetical protein